MQGRAVVHREEVSKLTGSMVGSGSSTPAPADVGGTRWRWRGTWMRLEVHVSPGGMEARDAEMGLAREGR